jgi:hypothetical protein
MTVSATSAHGMKSSRSLLRKSSMLLTIRPKIKVF